MVAIFQNLGVVAEIAGEPAATQLRETAERELSRLGPTSSIDGGLVTAARGTSGDLIDRTKSVSWLAYTLLGVTEAWRLRKGNDWLEGTVPRRLLEVSAGLRFGIEPLADDPAESVHKATESAQSQTADKRGITRFGFAPIWPQVFRTLTQISDPQCPACAAISPETIEVSEQHALERCRQCELEYERHRLWLVGGRDVGQCAALLCFE